MKNISKDVERVLRSAKELREAGKRASREGGEKIKQGEQELQDQRRELEKLSEKTSSVGEKYKNLHSDVQEMQRTNSGIGGSLQPYFKRINDLLAYFGENTPKKNYFITLGLASIIFSLFFLSSNLTGNVISNLTQNSSNLIGAGLFILGLIGCLFYFKTKKV